MQRSRLRTGMLVKTLGIALGDFKNSMVLLNTANGDILSAGETWCPIDTLYGERRTAKIIEVRQPRANCHYNTNSWRQCAVIWKIEDNMVEMSIADIEKKLGLKNLKIVK